MQRTVADNHARPCACAQDEAFCFRYSDCLSLLEAAGAQLVPFSPLADAQLPEELGGVLLPGGYPELHAAALAANVSMRESLRAFAAGGGLVYAECGGLMYCAAYVETGPDGKGSLEASRHPMLGLLPFGVAMTSRMAMGYVTATARPGGLLPPGATCRGQVYHFSRPVTPDGEELDLTEGGQEQHGVVATLAAQREAVSGGPSAEGFMPVAYRRVLATYVHLYLPSCPEAAVALVAEAAAAYSELHGGQRA